LCSKAAIRPPPFAFGLEVGGLLPGNDRNSTTIKKIFFKTVVLLFLAPAFFVETYQVIKNLTDPFVFMSVTADTIRTLTAFGKG
jgi:hypothetical protein